MGTGNRNGSTRDKTQSSGSFRVRSVKAWRRPDEEIDLPLDRCSLLQGISKGIGPRDP